MHSNTVLYALDASFANCVLHHVDVFAVVERGYDTYLVDIVQRTRDTRGLVYHAIYHGRLTALKALMRMGCTWNPLPLQHVYNPLPIQNNSAMIFRNNVSVRMMLVMGGYSDNETGDSKKLWKLAHYLFGSKLYDGSPLENGYTPSILMRYNRLTRWLEKNVWRIVDTDQDFVTTSCYDLRSGKRRRVV